MSDLPAYTPELAREMRGTRGQPGYLTQQEMCDLVGLSRRDQWARVEAGKAPGHQTWMLALIVSGRHPTYGPINQSA